MIWIFLYFQKVDRKFIPPSDSTRPATFDNVAVQFYDTSILFEALSAGGG